MWNTLHFLSSLLSATHLFLRLVRQTGSQLKTGDLVKTRRWLLIVHDFAGPFWLNCMDLPGVFTQWWVVCSNVSRWAGKTLHKQFKHKKVKTHISEIPSWILLDNDMRSWILDCYKAKLIKEKKVWNLPIKKNTTQSWNHWIQTKTGHQYNTLKHVHQTSRWANHPSL